MSKLPSIVIAKSSLFAVMIRYILTPKKPAHLLEDCSPFGVDSQSNNLEIRVRERADLASCIVHPSGQAAFLIPNS